MKEIAALPFAEQRNGYDKAQVDAYIARLSAEYLRLRERYGTSQGRTKSLQYINLEFGAAELEKRRQGAGKEKKKPFSHLMNVLFYCVIAAILLAALLFSARSGGGLQIFHYRAFHVITDSMQSQIPVGSLVLTHEVDGSEIRVGDDITFIRSDDAIVTHRVVNILENYQGSGELGFRTWGIENIEPDREIVRAGNVIGVVVGTVPNLGAVFSFISDNIGFVFLLLGAIAVGSIAISRLWGSGKREAAPQRERFTQLSPPKL
ncbi:MAG: signal peptidase I [Clostridiales bacterium]|nr:signal peptidase I [Clostridiales bacterium]